MINTYKVIPKDLNLPYGNLLPKFAGNRPLDMKI